MKDDLLIELTHLSKCDYISDLSLNPKKLLNREMIIQIPEDDYLLSEWLDAISYMTHSHVSASSIKEAKRYLLDFISTQ